MGKVSTNSTSSGGDERNIYIRRYKSTSNSSKASSNASLAKTMGESESSSRSKNTTNLIKQHPSKERNNTKSKLRSPIKVGSGQATNRVNRFHTDSTQKEIKKISVIIKKQNLMTKMKQESETLERKHKLLNLQGEDKESTEQVENIKQMNESNQINDQLTNPHETENTNGLDKKELQLEENYNNTESNKNGQNDQNGEVPELSENEDFHLHVEVEENLEIPNSYEDLSKTNTEDSAKKDLKPSDEEIQEHLQIGTQSYSVDVVESTTSEVPEATGLTTPSEINSKGNINQDENNDAISYDSSITLKDIKITLNDCLKDTKLEEENTADQGLPEYAHKEITFGKTLRTLSGRNSIGRMRHITLRDRQPSPNSSLFVNTSNISLSEDSISDYKIHRHRNTVLELTSTNGSASVDRKRKLIAENVSDFKKPKTENSLWNTSFELLKYPFGLQRPAQVSTPYKFQTEKHDLNPNKETKIDDSGIIKKWCVIM